MAESVFVPQERSGDAMASHDIPEDVKNSDILYLIDEYVRLERDRNILKDHWFAGLSFYDLAEKYDVSHTCIKSVIYGKGDKLLLKTTK